MKSQTSRFMEHLNNIYICVFLFSKIRSILHRENLLYWLLFSLRSWEILAYPWSLTERVIHWPRHFSSRPLLLMCCVHLSHQMCLCAASNTRCTQCLNALEKYIQRLDRALALSQQCEVGMATAVQSPPSPATITFQKCSLFTIHRQLPSPLTSIRQPPAKGHLYMSLFN